MNDDFRNAIKRLRDIYNYLTEGEPSPDEEEESQKEMITLLESLIMHIPPENMDENLELLKRTLGLAKEWDTLEYWFSELPELTTNIRLILNRFLIRHAEPEIKESHEQTTIPQENDIPDELSGQLAAALERAMKNLPPDADVTKVIQSVTSQVTEAYKEASTGQPQKIGLGGIPITNVEKEETSTGSSPQSQSNTTHSPDSMTSTAARVKIRKEDIMKSVLEQVKNKINEDEPQKLPAPKIIIPKVIKPKQKIMPYSEESLEPTQNDLKQQELDAIPLIKPQDKPKQPPKLKISAFKREKFPQDKPDIEVKTETQQPVRPKIVVKPKIKTKVEEIGQSMITPIPKPPAESKSEPKIEPETPKPPVSKKPKIKLHAKPVSKQKEGVVQEKFDNKSAIQFNVVKPSEPTVKDTQIDLFETFTKQEKKEKRRRSKKKSNKLPMIESESTNEQESYDSNGKSNSMNGIEFPQESIPYEKMDKTQLYQELIALEGKKYAIEKSRSDYRSKHEKGLISDGNYAAQLDRFKFDLNYISKKINEIRQRIQSI